MHLRGGLLALVGASLTLGAPAGAAIAAPAPTGAAPATVSAASCAGGPDKTPLAEAPLAGPTHAQQAITALGTQLAATAAAAGMTTSALRTSLRSDPTLWVDPCGRLFYADVPPESGETPATSPAEPASAIAPAAAFTLHSRAGSSRTIYLDFDGQYISGTEWNNLYGLPAWTAPPFDANSNPGSFSDSERALIISVWEAVADDFAPFDVDVTTEDPGGDALTRSSEADQRYGTRAVISPDAKIAAACGGCGGVAYVNVLNRVNGSGYQPAWVLAHRLSNNAKYIAEAASHEVGHNLNLSHDGQVTATGTQGYYLGSGGWAPIMGAGYYQNTSQWSRGEYVGATQTQDDVANIAAAGAPLISDDVPDTPASAATLTPGRTVAARITTAADRDWFTFNGSGQVRITATPSATAPDLDLRLVLARSDGTSLAASAPSYLAAGWPASAAASITYTLPAEGSYQVMVDGDGNGLPGTDGATDYGSLGKYGLTVALAGAYVTTPPPATFTVGKAATVELTAAGVLSPLAWNLAGGQLPPGMSLVGAQITGTPTGTGSYTPTLAVRDANGTTASARLTLSVAPELVASGPASRGLTADFPATIDLSAAGGASPITWTLATGNLPPGLTITNNQLTGTPTTPGTYQPTLLATDANNATATTGTLTLTVAAGLSTQGATAAETTTAQGGTGTLPAGEAGSTPTVPTGTPALAAGAALRLSLPRTTQLPPGRRGHAYSALLLPSGGTLPMTWKWISGKLPKGLRLTSRGELSGTPSKKGRVTLRLRVTDAAGQTATARFKLRVK